MKSIILSVLLFVYCNASAKKGVGCDAGCSANTITAMGAGWWYNWGAKPHVSSPVQFVPMVFSINRMTEVPPYSTHLLGFNEPNLEGLTPEQAATVWPSLVAKAGTIASPAQSGNPSRNNSWLEQFLNYKTKPHVDYVALHGYGTYHPQSFKDMVKNVTDKFGKPIWIT